MAKSNVLAVSSLLPLVLSLLLSNAASHPNHVVSGICHTSRNPPLCLTVLKHAGTTDLKGLVNFTLNVAHARAVDNLLLAQSLESKAVDPTLKARYNFCVGNYNDTIGDIDLAKSNLDTSYDGVNLNVGAAMDDLDYCHANFTFPPLDPSPLSNNAQDLEDIISIVLDIPYILPPAGSV